jgi:hypothetical protein
VPTRDENDTIKACLVELQQDLRPRLAQLHFTGGAKIFCFSSTSSSIGGAKALVKRLASNKKQ